MIKVKIFVFNDLQVNSFVLYDESKEAILIDPTCQYQNERDILSEYIESNQLKPKKIVITHGHVDHIVGVKYCMEKYQIPYYMHADDSFLLGSAVKMGSMYGFEMGTIPSPAGFINEGEQIHFGNSTLDIIHVPGHSPGSVLFYSRENNFLIAGDVLFSGSIGRTDLPGGNYESLINGIIQKLLILPPETVVFPGHGPSTTIKEEHESNPFLI